MATRALPLLKATCLVGILLAAGAAAAHAQLRPLDPLDWRILDDGHDMVGSIGGGVLFGQPAPLAGSEGRLLEIGNYRLLWRSGRIGVDLGGTALWRYREQRIVEQPVEPVEPAVRGVRQDPGPATAGAFVRLSPLRWRTNVVLRFGARIPITSDDSGLERDETDFYALLGARHRLGTVALAGEAGVGIHGSIVEGYRQSDVFAFNFGALHQAGALETSAFVVGHQDGHAGRVRGNEDQRELRVALRYGRARWLRATWILGIGGYGPAHGLQLGAGFGIRCLTDCLP